MKKIPLGASSEPETNIVTIIFTTIALFIVGLIASFVFQPPPMLPETPPPLEEPLAP